MKTKHRQFWKEVEEISKDIVAGTPLLSTRDNLEFLIDKLLEAKILHPPSVRFLGLDEGFHQEYAQYSLYYQAWIIAHERQKITKWLIKDGSLRYPMILYDRVVDNFKCYKKLSNDGKGRI
jgi:hypothetical protein